MKHLTIILSIVTITLTASCGDDGSGPSGPSTSNSQQFYPLAVGNTWNYDRSGSISLSGTQIGTVSGVATIEISGTETHSEGFDVYVQDVHVTDTTTTYGQSFYTDSSFTEYLRLTDSGLYGYRHLTDTDSSFVVPFPFQAGFVWDFQEEPPTTGEILSVTASVMVPAGTFNDCVEMQLLWIDSAMIVSNTADLARNVGEIRNRFINTVDYYVTDITNSLVSYTLY